MQMSAFDSDAGVSRTAGGSSGGVGGVGGASDEGERFFLWDGGRQL